jgi:tetratricopeptide (TPR) repeat protein
VNPRKANALLAALALALALAASGATREEALAAKQAGDHARAIALFTELSAAAPEDTGLLLQLGTVQGWAGRHDDAIATLERALGLAPADAELRLALARALAWAGQLERAQQIADAVVTAHPRNLDAIVLQGRIQAWRRNYAAAENIYQSALHVSPQNVDALVGLGDLRRWQESFDEARAFYARAQKLDPASADLAAKLASVRSAGRWRLDAGGEISTFSGGARSDWRGLDAALRYTLNKHSGLSAGAERARRFGFTDMQFTAGLDHRFDDRRTGYVRLSATPDADFFADTWSRSAASGSSPIAPARAAPPCSTLITAPPPTRPAPRIRSGRVSPNISPAAMR